MESAQCMLNILEMTHVLSLQIYLKKVYLQAQYSLQDHGLKENVFAGTAFT
jgi:hypothetical protein